MSAAAEVTELMQSGRIAAAAFCYGYAVTYAGARIFFPRASVRKERRNGAGRVVSGQYQFPDRSILVMRFRDGCYSYRERTP